MSVVAVREFLLAVHFLGEKTFEDDYDKARIELPAGYDVPLDGPSDNSK